MPWTTWGRFAHNSPRARVKVHSPRVLESRSAGQRALAPPTDGHPPDFRTIQTLHNHFPCHPPTAFQPRYGRHQPPRNHNLFTTISPTIKQPLPNPALTIGNRNPSTTVLQPLFYPRTRKTLLQPLPTASHRRAIAPQNGRTFARIRKPLRQFSHFPTQTRMPPTASQPRANRIPRMAAMTSPATCGGGGIRRG